MPCIRIISNAFLCLFLLAWIAAGFAQDRGAKREADPTNPVMAYRKKWAVIIGINYQGEVRGKLNRGKLMPLSNAENDAKKLCELLKTNFDYKDEEVVLLTGANATQAAIREKLHNGLFGARQQVKDGDSVLFFFSGHGYLHRTQDSKPRGYLLPFDVKMLENDEPDRSTAIDVTDDLVQNLKENCAARHKLLVLDCCHSGAVFRIDDGYASRSSEIERRDTTLFKEPAFQAITSSRATQKAADGSTLIGHSPFTAALLRSLRTIPLSQSWEPFTANQLFRAMDVHLTMDVDRQTAQCRTLTGLGEFHFFPKQDAPWGEEKLTPEAQRMLLATVPSTFGSWWMEDVPWFMPSLRLKILEHQPKDRSQAAESLMDRELLKTTAKDIANLSKTQDSGKHASELTKMRVEHLERLLNARQREARQEAMEEVVKQLEAKRKEKKLEVTDLHYLAALFHQLGKFELAGPVYEEAVREYNEKSKLNRSLVPLHALCLVDQGIFELKQGGDRLDVARNCFRAARRLSDRELPTAFRMYVFCREADALRLQRKVGLADQHLQAAQDLARGLEKTASALLAAATCKHVGIARMEQCRFREASEAFERARGILDRRHDGTLPDECRDGCEIEDLHVRQWTALINRFQGHDAEALAQYRKLTPDIVEFIRGLDRRTAEVSNLEEKRKLLILRYLDSVERQADCCLFGLTPDYAEAADDYRLAIRACPYLPGDVRLLREADLMYRRAIALCLPSPAPAAVPTAPVRDIALALHLCKEADSLHGQVQKLPVAEGNEPIAVQLSQAIAWALVHTVEPEDAAARQKHVQPLVDLLLRFRGPAIQKVRDRDLLERLMFGYKILLDHRHVYGFDRHEITTRADDLQAICRSMVRSGTRNGRVDADLLRYLRVYYDTAFAAKLGIKPVPVKELIENSWEATRGTLYAKPESGEPLLVMHRAGNKCYLLLDVPNGVSKCFGPHEIWTEQTMRVAGEKAIPLAIPEDVQQALRGLNKPLVVRWRDPVTRRGYPLAVTDNPADSPQLSQLIPDRQFRFPFDLQGIALKTEDGEANPGFLPPLMVAGIMLVKRPPDGASSPLPGKR